MFIQYFVINLQTLIKKVLAKLIFFD